MRFDRFMAWVSMLKSSSLHARFVSFEDASIIRCGHTCVGTCGGMYFSALVLHVREWKMLHGTMTHLLANRPTHRKFISKTVHQYGKRRDLFQGTYV